jgi:FAD/FMN-containing dehydrogenase
MLQVKKAILLSTLALTAVASTSFKHHSWQHEDAGLHTTNILEQFYPDQNAFRLFDMIPSELRHLSYAIYPVSRGYDTARFNFNKRFNLFPHAIFAPRTKEEIAHVLKALKKHHLTFSIRSGGHSYEPASLSSSYIIDLRNFDALKMNWKRQEVYIGAGVRLGTVIETLGKHNFAIPTGTCSSVGVAGLSLGGGVGVLGRIVGLTCDSIKSITLLTAEGKVIEVNSKNHSDLFWALRGAGNGSYGIVLGLTFKMHYIPKVSYFNLSWKWDPKTVPHIIHAWQSWVETLPHNISTQLHLKYLNHQLSIEVTGLKVSTKSFSEWKTAFKHLHPKVTITRESYLQSAQQWADRAPFPFFKAKSEILMKPLTNEPIHEAVKFFEELKAKEENYYAFFEFEAFGGKIPKSHTAFFPRKAFGWWLQTMYWDKPAQEPLALHKLRKFHSDISPFVSKHAYANIIDYDLEDKYLEAYYGDHVHHLMHIKRKYDPENIFHWKQSIPLHKLP